MSLITHLCRGLVMQTEGEITMLLVINNFIPTASIFSTCESTFKIQTHILPAKILLECCQEPPGSHPDSQVDTWEATRIPAHLK